MWLIYALGGGWGHLTRAIALARAAATGTRVRILSNSPFAQVVAASMPGLEITILDADASAERTRAAAVATIADIRPPFLIVDTFPRGIGGELAEVLGKLDACKVLVHRDLNPRYVESAHLREFVARHYDLVIVPGAGEGSELGDLPAAVVTDPWLVRSPGELPDRTKARQILDLGTGEDTCVLVCASGKADERAWYEAAATEVRTLAPELAVRSIACDRGVRYWPAMDLYGCAAVVIGGAGYNTVEECLAWRVPLVARAWKRTYDRQEQRARRASSRGTVVLVTEPEEAARAAVRHMLPGFVETPKFSNGAMQAAALIAGLTPVS